MTQRKEVIEFANAMEMKLNQNYCKEYWKYDSLKRLIRKIKAEVTELEDALVLVIDNPELECIDIANYAMMIYDNLKGGKTYD